MNTGCFCKTKPISLWNQMGRFFWKCIASLRTDNGSLKKARSILVALFSAWSTNNGDINSGCNGPIAPCLIRIQIPLIRPIISLIPSHHSVMAYHEIRMERYTKDIKERNYSNYSKRHVYLLCCVLPFQDVLELVKDLLSFSHGFCFPL